MARSPSDTLSRSLRMLTDGRADTEGIVRFPWPDPRHRHIHRRSRTSAPKADVVDYPTVFNHVGLLVNEPSRHRRVAIHVVIRGLRLVYLLELSEGLLALYSIIYRAARGGESKKIVEAKAAGAKPILWGRRLAGRFHLLELEPSRC